MWQDAFDLLERADRMHRQFFVPAAARSQRPTWQPPVDLIETEGELWILVALPGVEADQLQVAIDGATLIVAGERPMPGRSRAAVIRRLEIPYGHFERRIELPAGRFEIDRRELVNGCLVLSLQKRG
jgi:HSP20 family molecular chaperone IbpA